MSDDKKCPQGGEHGAKTLQRKNAETGLYEYKVICPKCKKVLKDWHS